MTIYFENKELRTEKKYQDAGIDIPSKENLVIKPGQTKMIKTGVSSVIDENHFGYITGRSSLNAKGILTIQGTIDPEYRGEIRVVLHNLSNEDFEIKKGDRIAQMILMEFNPDYCTMIGKAIKDTARGANGFGSTGR